MIDWIRANEQLLWWLGSLSIVTFVGCLIAIPIIVGHIPEDYFARRRRREPLARVKARHPIVLAILIGLKNLLGLVFVLAGIAMLFLPGQGILTMLIGLMLMNFPGKFALERRIVRIPMVLRAMNWIRSRRGRPPLRILPP